MDPQRFYNGADKIEGWLKIATVRWKFEVSRRIQIVEMSC
jgi:hypothetical protein